MQNLFRSIIFIFLIMYASLQFANAKCYTKADESSRRKINIISAVYKDKERLDGCLVTYRTAAGNTGTAYAPYQFICDLPAKEEIEVTLIPPCCDTDVCESIPYGAKVTIEPAEMDKRAIPELVAMGLRGSKRDAEAVMKLMFYVAHGGFKNELEIYLPKLEEAIATGNAAQPDVHRAIVDLLKLAKKKSSSKISK